MSAATGRLITGLYASPPLLLGLATLFWAGNTIAGQLAVGQVSPMLLTFIRWVLVSAAMFVLFRSEIAAYWPEVRKRIWYVAAMAAFGFSAFNGLFYTASISTTAINLGIFQGSMPMFVLAGACLLQGQKLTAVAALGVVVALTGVVVVASKGSPLNVLSIGLNPGDALMLLACICYAGYTVALKERPPIPGRAFFALMAPIAALTALPMALTEAALGYSQTPTPFGWLVALWIAVFPSTLSQLFFLRGVDLIGPGRAGVYVNLVPVFAPILAVLILGQRFEGFHAVGLSLVLAGIWLSQRSGRRPDPPPASPSP